MATSREERMQQRMRGAGRHEVSDESFGFILPVEESPEAPVAAPEPAPEPEPEPEPTLAPTPAPVPATRPTPNTSANTSAKRRRLNTGTVSVQPARARSIEEVEQPVSAAKGNPYDVRHDESPDGPPPGPALVRPAAEETENVEDTMESLPEPVPRPASRESVSGLVMGPDIIEEVTESPAGAPGSGHRRRIRDSDVTTKSAKLQRAVLNEDDTITGEFANSSPLARKTRKAGATPSAPSIHSTQTRTRSAIATAYEQDDYSSPRTRLSRKSASTAASSSARSNRSGNRRSTLRLAAEAPDELASPVPLVESRRRAQAKAKGKGRARRVPEPAQVEAKVTDDEGEANIEEAEEAEEIDANETARRIGRKRLRESPSRGESPELHEARPAKKHRQKRMQESPAKQSQPKAQKNKPKATRRRQSDGEHIPITVQRYTKRQRHDEDDTDADILNSEIPFTNRGGVNVVDVLSQMCDEVIESNLVTLQEAIANAQDAATKREYRTKLRALEAFQEELRTRLLEHTIALDTLHALKKRVRSVQKEKLSLRNEIIRIRAEREQVALKMDAVRIRHDTESQKTLDQLKLSSAMHDIELAVENGRSAPDLGPKEQKMADLANLELLATRVAGQACGEVGGSGSLQQLKDFNALLERAATVLEVR
ncbi:uncharacterized protein BCR38DRAFT_461984 [Pseudomassariella vexata]|uniref:Inner kinetochore subunit AME1 domain-containing protein n=1 Tax=Pseudomassariella vexata TaxID=1141098 RepID=A0A1Y2D8H0_9PEZI|nr:uncharacterized protein BCR38DRAFT_461984 [Pseudomassariella vexata]ORY55474.1 hypothetical protein BCR38DRAFT_461984 [Pseudomassariella vexata]